jgi:hypothetical protein
MMFMKKIVIVLFSAVFTTSFSQAQTVKTQTRSATKIQMWMPDKWATTAWQNAQADDNQYIKSKTLNGANLGGVAFLNLGFTLPTTATIQKIEANIIRFKTGRNNVFENTVALVKHLNDVEYCGGSENMASKDPWTDFEKKMLYSFSTDGKDCKSQPFKWTPEEVNKPMFGFFIHPSISTGGKGAAALIEQVTVTVYYTEQYSSTIQTAGRINLLQRGNTVIVDAPSPGKYMLTVSDNFGRTIQQTVLRTGQNETVQLNAGHKGYCVITVEGNGIRNSIKTFVQ